MRTTALICGSVAVASGLMAPVAAPARPVAVSRASAPSMDETIIEKALSGELEQEGAENVFMSELGWAAYLDEACGSSYNMNERYSLAEDGYVTPTVFSNPIDVIIGWKDSMTNKVLANPLETAFMTISNDQSGARSYPKGATEVSARTIKPKVKNFDPSMRVTGIPGFNFFGAPSSKQEKFFENSDIGAWDSPKGVPEKKGWLFGPEGGFFSKKN